MKKRYTINFLLVIFTFSVCYLTSVGYSVLQKVVTISGSTFVSNSPDVIVSGISAPFLGSYIPYTSYTNDTISFSVQAGNQSYYIIDVELTNNSSNDMQLDTLVENTYSNEFITYSLYESTTGTPLEKYKIPAQSTVNLELNLYKDELAPTMLDSNILTAEFQFTFKQYTPPDLVITSASWYMFSASAPQIYYNDSTFYGGIAFDRENPAYYTVNVYNNSNTSKMITDIVPSNINGKSDIWISDLVNASNGYGDIIGVEIMPNTTLGISIEFNSNYNNVVVESFTIEFSDYTSNNSDLEIINISNYNTTNGGFIVTTFNYVDNYFGNGYISLPNNNSTISFDVTVMNTSSIPKKIYSFNVEDLEYYQDIELIKTNYRSSSYIPANSSKTITFTFKYKSGTSSSGVNASNWYVYFNYRYALPT